MTKESNNKNSKKKSPIAEREEEILAFWNKHKIFEKSLEKQSPQGEFVFYDGPPFATGLPHYGHLLAGTIKDVIPRFKTMQGYYVRRRWGWDCHGLPLENLVEKKLELQSKKDIQEYGIATFNETAKDFVLQYADDWKKIVPRTGRWVDMENDYRTMDSTYSESVWWAFKTLYEKDLIYKDFKSMHLCPRCETTLSNFEVAQGYKDVKDFSVTVKLRLVDEHNTSLLIWTTTPWTLPGNVAAAVNPELMYVTVAHEGEQYIVAEEMVATVFKDKEYSEVKTVSGSELIDKKYIPPFPYYANVSLENKDNAWKVYPAEYVAAEEGTGIVHIAPAFGAEDLELAREQNIPLIHHVDVTGSFVDAVTDFAGVKVKQKGDSQSADIEIIKALAHSGTLFAKEKIEHSYPHCWRCDTPLLNYATSSWFVKVSALKSDIIEENKKVSWVPDHIGTARFHKLLEGAPDWAISRSRYWGAPLPVWECDSCDTKKVVGSFDELKTTMQSSGNTYFAMRHGEADSNVTETITSKIETQDHLTDKGRQQVSDIIAQLKELGITRIVHSPFIRTTETAHIVKEGLGLSDDAVTADENLVEVHVGSLDGKPYADHHTFMNTTQDKFRDPHPGGGESYVDVKRRMTGVLYTLEEKYIDETILIISHGTPLWMLMAGAQGLNCEQIDETFDEDFRAFGNAEIRSLDFAPFPHNADYELDVHRPYIDDITVMCSCGETMQRVDEVFDCWFESGSMPYASNHYPFENRDIFDPEKKHIGFPADFIAEGLDQTRGWFYSLLVLSTGLFGRSPYQNVIVNGIILAEDGQKMSKKLQNYPDPLTLIDQYGADALRYYLLASPVVRAEDLNFSEQGVGEIVKKVVLRISNVVNFYEMYAPQKRQAGTLSRQSANVLDIWILERLRSIVRDITIAFEKYELDKAMRPLADFIEDLSVWYVRRSRDRFKVEGDEKEDALETLGYVLVEITKVMAPSMPFLAEHIYRRLTDAQESVHLEEWPKEQKAESEKPNVLGQMEEVRRIVSLALEARASAAIKVRQPLQSLTVQKVQFAIADNKQLLELIANEVNVKEVLFDDTIQEEVVLDTIITPELKKEGQLRDLIRHIQSLRKKEKLSPEDIVTLYVDTNDVGKDLMETYTEEIQQTTSVREFIFEKVEGAEAVEVDDIEFRLFIKK